MPRFGFGFGPGRRRRVRDGVPPVGPTPPVGHVFLTDTDGALLTDADGAYLTEPA